MARQFLLNFLRFHSPTLGLQFMKTSLRILSAALAVASMSGAWAQSSVQLYGAVNVSVDHHKQDGMSASGLVSNGSFLGLRAQEDLGAGLKAGVVLEADINADTGAGSDLYEGYDANFNFQRHSELYVQSGWGKLRMGALDVASEAATIDAVQWHSDDWSSTSDALAYKFRTRANALGYESPWLAGWKFNANWLFGERKNLEGLTEQLRDGLDMAVRYTNGPWGLGLGMLRLKSKDPVYGDHSDDHIYSLRMSYEAPSWAIGGYVQHDRYNSYEVGISDHHDKNTAWAIFGKYVIGASELHASYGQSRWKRSIGDYVDGSTWRFKQTFDQLTLAYHYNLSRRTKLYAAYTHGDISYVTKSLLDTLSENGRKIFSVGMRHSF